MITPSFGLTATERVLPSMALDFTAASLDSRITFTRTGATATRVNSSGFVASVAADTARFDFDPVSLVCKGLLIEESRTNLILYSTDINNAAWVQGTFSSITNDAAISPDGTQNADKMVALVGVGSHNAYQGFTTTAQAYTWSVYAKSAGYTQLSITVQAPTPLNNFYDLSAGTVISTAAGCTTTITNAGNGWYRCTATYTAAAGTSYIVIGSAVAGSGVFNGNGVDGIYAWGVQIEAGAFATSYIPTTTLTVTRNADIAVMTGTNFSSWFNASAGTFRATYEASPNTFTAYFVASNGVTAQNSIHFDNDGGNMRAVYYSGSSAVATLGLGAIGTVGTVNSLASSYAVNNFAAARNAGTVVTDTSGAVPLSLTQMNIGADPSGTAVNVMNTRIQKIFYYPLALTSAEVQAFSKG
jgi:hypothetical protein